MQTNYFLRIAKLIHCIHILSKLIQNIIADNKVYLKHFPKSRKHKLYRYQNQNKQNVNLPVFNGEVPSLPPTAYR